MLYLDASDSLITVDVVVVSMLPTGDEASDAATAAAAVFLRVRKKSMISCC